MEIAPVTLEGEFVRLEPLHVRHAGPLATVGLDPSIWTWFPAQIASPEDMQRWVGSMLALQVGGMHLPFATIERATGRAVGSTSFGNIAAEHRRVEIGWTWIAPAWQRTAVNTEAKWLMLAHAFETWQVNRVELKTDALNARSRKAILRLGAIEEGTLRRHMVMPDGRVRDTVYFSITSDAWLGVREGLDRRLRPMPR